MNAAAIRLLAEKGLSASDIAEVAETLEQKKDATGAERQRRYRERKKAENGPVTRDVTRDDVTDRPLSRPPNENNSNPPTHTPEYKTRARKGHRLPIDWEPKPLPATMGSMLARWEPGEMERELAKFRDWAASANGPNALKKDWDAAWRNWLRKHDEERKPANDRQPSSTANAAEMARANLAGSYQ